MSSKSNVYYRMRNSLQTRIEKHIANNRRTLIHFNGMTRKANAFKHNTIRIIVKNNTSRNKMKQVFTLFIPFKHQNSCRWESYWRKLNIGWLYYVLVHYLLMVLYLQLEILENIFTTLHGAQTGIKLNDFPMVPKNREIFFI